MQSLAFEIRIENFLKVLGKACETSVASLACLRDSEDDASEGLKQTSYAPGAGREAIRERIKYRNGKKDESDSENGEVPCGRSGWGGKGAYSGDTNTPPQVDHFCEYPYYTWLKPPSVDRISKLALPRGHKDPQRGRLRAFWLPFQPRPLSPLPFPSYFLP